MTTHSIHIMPDGQIEGVQQDALNLCELGHVTNERASVIVWNEKLQAWVATIHPEFHHGCGPHSWSHVSRQACIDWEVNYLNQN